MFWKFQVWLSLNCRLIGSWSCLSHNHYGDVDRNFCAENVFGEPQSSLLAQLESPSSATRSNRCVVPAKVTTSDGVCRFWAEELSGRTRPRWNSFMALILTSFSRVSTFAFGMVSPNVRRGDFRGGGRGPVHDFPYFHLLLTQVSTICFEMEPTFIVAHTLHFRRL
jgi:hypothetical protein